MPYCIRCGRKVPPKAKFCNYCGATLPKKRPGKQELALPSDYLESETSPSTLWYLVPIFFGLLGGIIAYIGVKGEDERMAGNLLWAGIIMTIIYLILLANYISTIMRLLGI